MSGAQPFPLVVWELVSAWCLVPGPREMVTLVITHRTFQLSWCRVVDRCVMSTGRHHVCLEEGIFCVQLGARYRGPGEGSMCGMSAYLLTPLCLRMRGWALPHEGFLAPLRASMSLLGELRRKGVPCPLVGAQQIHRDATLWAHCVPGHPRAAWTTSHFFFWVPPFKIPLSELSIPSAPLPFLRGLRSASGSK